MHSLADSPLFRALEDRNIQCLCCQHKCVISPGKLGRCRARANIDGTPISPTWGQYTVAVDPVEKKPLYHFLPGSKVYSYGSVGCNFNCQFCQNSSLSMWKLDIEDVAALEESEGRRLRQYTPAQMVQEALRTGCKSIASTYNEPTVSSEFSHEVFQMAKEKGLYTIYVTNGFESVETLNYLAPYLDAVNIDLKSFREEFYSKVCGAHLQGVCDTIKRCVAMGIHTEVTTLVIPGENDSEAELRDVAEFLASIDKEIVWHVSAYHDDYKFHGRGRTPLKTLERASRIGREAGLVYVYMGNVIAPEARMTVCPKCGAQLIDRDWNHADIMMKKGKCKCGQIIPGLFSDASNLKPKVNEVPQELVDLHADHSEPTVRTNRNVVYFASQGGTSKRIAEEVALELGFEVDNMQNMRVQDLEELNHVVFCVSTYGRGAPPQVVASIWSEMKKLTHLENPVQFAVVGCGSSSFSRTFVGFAKDLEQQMTNIGGQKVADMCVHDEADDEEVDVKSWAHSLKFH